MKHILLTNNSSDFQILQSQLLPFYSGKDILIFVKNDKGNLKNKNVEVISFNKYFSLLSYIYYVLKLYGQIKKYDKAIIHCRGFVSGVILFFASIFLKNKNRKIIYDPRGPFLLQRKECGWTNKLLIKILSYIEANVVDFSTYVIVESESLKSYFIAKYNNEGKYFCIYNTSLLDTVTKKKSGVTSVVYLGSFNYWHPYMEVLKLFKYIETISPCSKFHVFSGSLSSEIQSAFIKELGSSIVFKCVPYNELGKELSQMDIGVSPLMPTESNRYTSPIKLFDYMCCNLKIISSKTDSDIELKLKKKGAILLYEYGKPNFNIKDLNDLNCDYQEIIDKYHYRNANHRFKVLLDSLYK